MEHNLGFVLRKPTKSPNKIGRNRHTVYCVWIAIAETLFDVQNYPRYFWETMYGVWYFRLSRIHGSERELKLIKEHLSIYLTVTDRHVIVVITYMHYYYFLLLLSFVPYKAWTEQGFHKVLNRKGQTRPIKLKHTKCVQIFPL